MHRGWMDNPVFKREVYSEREAWIWLIENAVFKACRIRVAGVMVNLERGQVAASLRHMASVWQWNDPRVRRFLARLKDDQMIELSTSSEKSCNDPEKTWSKIDAGNDARRDARITVISVTNYDTYQTLSRETDAPIDAASDARPTQERRRSDAGATQEEEDKESKKVRMKEDRDPDGSLAASAPQTLPAAPAVDPKTIIFGEVRKWLVGISGKNDASVRAWLGKCCRDYGEGTVIEVASVMAAQPPPVDPFPAMKAMLEKRRNGYANGSVGKRWEAAFDDAESILEAPGEDPPIPLLRQGSGPGNDDGPGGRLAHVAPALQARDRH